MPNLLSVIFLLSQFMIPFNHYQSTLNKILATALFSKAQWFLPAILPLPYLTIFPIGNCCCQLGKCFVISYASSLPLLVFPTERLVFHSLSEIPAHPQQLNSMPSRNLFFHLILLHSRDCHTIYNLKS